MVLHLQAQGLEEGDEHSPTLSQWSMANFAFFALPPWASASLEETEQYQRCMARGGWLAAGGVTLVVATLVIFHLYRYFNAKCLYTPVHSWLRKWALKRLENWRLLFWDGAMRVPTQFRHGLHYTAHV